MYVDNETVVSQVPLTAANQVPNQSMITRLTYWYNVYYVNENEFWDGGMNLGCMSEGCSIHRKEMPSRNKQNSGVRFLSAKKKKQSN